MSSNQCDTVCPCKHYGGDPIDCMGPCRAGFLLYKNGIGLSSIMQLKKILSIS